jgi:ABC-type microcin C transport system permease subunit YejE
MSATTVAKLDLKTQKSVVGESLTSLALKRLRRDKLTLLAMAIVITLTALSLFAPLIEEYILQVDYTRTNISETFLPVGTPGHILGTDDLGRDHLARLLYAGQISLGIAFFAAILSLVIGITLGIMTGYYGHLVDYHADLDPDPVSAFDCLGGYPHQSGFAGNISAWPIRSGCRTRPAGLDWHNPSGARRNPVDT